MDLSKEMNQEFNTQIKNQNVHFGFKFDVQVLTKGCWPESDHAKAKIPEKVQTAVNSFELFYKKKFQGKNL